MSKELLIQLLDNDGKVLEDICITSNVTNNSTFDKLYKSIVDRTTTYEKAMNEIINIKIKNIEESEPQDKFINFLASLDDKIIALENKNKECLLKFDKELIKEKLTLLETCSTSNNYTFNINIENSSNIDVDKLLKQISNELEKLGKWQ
ncbi:MAG: hypothetical protein LLF98_01845 [Clostridium sp.]|uniref:hypothetical protein n=1 Tax=Clostridium sp. TaxID=1506 RepID=UPI0025C0F2F4|nr:hypothetical protein [Clostridium sp.]MCE5220023.1 hypothetical protein [Clostridium sp.]